MKKKKSENNIKYRLWITRASPVVSGKFFCNAGDTENVGSTPVSGKFPEEGPCNPLQYSCRENPMDRGAWQAMVHGVAELDTSKATEHACMG